jgi:hypothetical protein
MLSDAKRSAAPCATIAMIGAAMTGKGAVAPIRRSPQTSLDTRDRGAGMRADRMFVRAPSASMRSLYQRSD